MEYLEDYEDDRTEEIIRYTWNKARYTLNISLKKDKQGQVNAQERGAGAD